jgi:MFS family permease
MNTAALKATIGPASRKKRPKRKKKGKGRSQVRFDLNSNQAYSFSLALPNIKQSETTLQYFLITAYIIGWSTVWANLYLVTIPYQVQQIVGDTKKAVTLGNVIAVGGIVSVLSPPIAGYMSDRTITKYGRRKPYICIGTIGCSVFIILLGYCNDVVSLCVCWVFLTLFSNFGSTAFYALMPDVVPPQDLGKTSGIIAVNTSIGQIISAGLGIWLDEITKNNVYILLAAVHIIFMLVTVLSVKEDVEGLRSEENRNKTTKTLNSNNNNNNTRSLNQEETKRASNRSYDVEVNSEYHSLEDLKTDHYPHEETLNTHHLRAVSWRIYDIFKQIIRPFKSSTFLWIYVTRFFIQMGIYSVQEMYQYYIGDIVHKNGDSLSVTAMTSYSLGMLTCMGGISGFICGYLSDQWGGIRKMFVYVGGFCMMVAVNLLMFTNSFVSVALISTLFGIGLGGYSSIDMAMVVDYLELQESEKEDEETNAGLEMAIWHTSLTFPQIIATP